MHKIWPGRRLHCTLKNTRVRNWPGKGSLGPNSIPGQRWPGNQSNWRGMWPRAGSIWPHYLSSLQKADQFPGHLWPGIDPGVFRVWAKCENINNSDLDGMPLASFCRNRATRSKTLITPSSLGRWRETSVQMFFFFLSFQYISWEIVAGRLLGPFVTIRKLC